MMYYFKFNIGDYHKKAGRLSMLEHGAYTLLIHSCYDRERFPTEEEALDWCWARTDEEIQAVRFVLRKFFEVKEGRYVQARIQDEIDAYHGRQETNRAIALEREARKRTKRAKESTKRERSVQDRTPNQEPLTKNQEPNNTLQRPEGVDVTVWRDFVQHRKRQRADVTVTALCGIQREAKKAGWTLEQALRECVVRGWRGFKADWVEKQNTEGKLNAI